MNSAATESKSIIIEQCLALREEAEALIVQYTRASLVQNPSDAICTMMESAAAKIRANAAEYIALTDKLSRM